MDNNFNNDNMQPQGNGYPPQGNDRDFSDQFAQYNQPRNAEGGNDYNPYQQPAQPDYNQYQPQQPAQPDYNQYQPQQPDYNQYQPQQPDYNQYQPVQPDYNNQYQQPYDYNAGAQPAYNMPNDVLTGAPKVFSIISLICGILSMVACCYGMIPAIPGLIFAIVAKSKFKGKNTMAQLGLIFSIVGMVLSIIWIIVAVVMAINGKTSTRYYY